MNKLIIKIAIIGLVIGVVISLALIFLTGNSKPCGLDSISACRYFNK